MKQAKQHAHLGASTLVIRGRVCTVFGGILRVYSRLGFKGRLYRIYEGCPGILIHFVAVTLVTIVATASTGVGALAPHNNDLTKNSIMRSWGHFGARSSGLALLRDWCGWANPG